MTDIFVYIFLGILCVLGFGFIYLIYFEFNTKECLKETILKKVLIMDCRGKYSIYFCDKVVIKKNKLCLYVSLANKVKQKKICYQLKNVISYEIYDME